MRPGFEIEPIPTKNIPAAWVWLGPMLAPAIGLDNAADMQSVFSKLSSGQCELAKVKFRGGVGLVVSELCVVNDVKCCWLSYVVGACEWKPKEFIRNFRHIMVEYEDMARKTGAEEIRIGGRLARIFSDFESYDEADLEKRRKVI